MTSKRLIFHIEDDSHIRELVDSILTKNGFAVSGAETAETALRRMPKYKPSLILLDFELPGIDGLEACKRIRAHPVLKSVPIILVTVHDSEPYKITALEAGADDFVVKPFSHGELLARVKAVIRRTYSRETPRNAQLKDGELELDLEGFTATLAGTKLELTAKEFAIMNALAHSNGRVLAREWLSAQIWEQEYYPTSRTIDAHVARLRKKLGKYRKLIQTVGRIGYRYNGSVVKS